jgi:HD-GYP domain-containing protein (c-di-GMP phosphodiesterase class II)
MHPDIEQKKVLVVDDDAAIGRILSRILTKMDRKYSVAPIAEIVHQHHERIDGSGYPQGLKGAEIFPDARIMAVADVVEAMASHRPYRPSLGTPAALDEISKNRGVLYDTQAADACLSLFRDGGFKFG